jgi:hypothetical protein
VLLLYERTQNRFQSLVAAGEQHHISDVDGRPPSMSVVRNTDQRVFVGPPCSPSGEKKGRKAAKLAAE